MKIYRKVDKGVSMQRCIVFSATALLFSAGKAVSGERIIPSTTIAGKLDPWIHYTLLDHHLESSPFLMEGLICQEWFKELLYQKIAASQARTVHSKIHSVCPICTRNIGPWVHYPELDQHLESNPCPTEGLICHEWFQELLYQEIAASQSHTVHSNTDRQVVSNPHKKYRVHRFIIQY